jgi:hypothetical protein
MISRSAPSADPHKRRKKTDQYADFQMLPNGAEANVVFLGGKDYVPLFCNLSTGIRNVLKVFYNSTHTPDSARCKFRRFETTTRTNWHYECANALIDGSI